MKSKKKRQYNAPTGRPRVAVQNRTGWLAATINEYLERGGTIRDLAHDTGTSPVTIWRYYTEGDPESVSTARRVASAARRKGCRTIF